MIIEVYQNEEELLLKLDSPVMIRVGEQLSLLEEDYYKYYIVKKVWYRIERKNIETVPCVEVIIDD